MGPIDKLHAVLNNPIDYALPIGDEKLPLNNYLGKPLTLRWEGKITCQGCGNGIKKAYQPGYCYPCTQRLARCDLCIVKPERCHFHLGTCREPEWGESHCFITHYLYLANTSGLKVGITRHTQIPTRWIDQGATQAIPLGTVSTRRQAGYVEVLLAKYLDDKTNWRTLLKGEAVAQDLAAKRDELLNEHGDDLQAALAPIEGQFEASTDDMTELNYPILEYPTTIKSLSFDKMPEISGTLMGIKGQYLLFDNHTVLNIRKHSGYHLAVMT